MPLPLEPDILSLIFKSYTGEKKDGYYHGNGHAEFKKGDVYAGDFIGGRMHGVGHFTWTDGTVYTGTFDNNQLQGEGHYDWTDKSIYDGGIKNGKRHGKGTFKSGIAPLKYEGEWTEGTRNGKGLLVYNEYQNVFYDGEWKNDKRHGSGTMRYASGNIYKGEWTMDVKNGQGSMTWFDVNEKYTGGWKNDCQEGRGEHVWMESTVGEFSSIQKQMNNRYVGEFIGGKRHGFGTFFYANGSQYEGEWEDNFKQGQGVFTFDDGSIYDGAFMADKMVNRKVILKAEDVIKPKMILYIDDLLIGEKGDTKAKTEVDNAVLRINSDLKALYKHYSAIQPFSTSGYFALNLSGLWKMVCDCDLISNTISLARIDRMLLATRQQHKKALTAAQVASGRIGPASQSHRLNENIEIHDEKNIVLYREFVELLVRIAHATAIESESSKSLAEGIITLYLDHLRGVLASGKEVDEWEKQSSSLEMTSVWTKYQNSLKNLFTTYGTRSQSTGYPDTTLSLHSFLRILKSLKLVDEELSIESALESVGTDSSDWTELDTEMIFMEFQTALTKIANIRVPQILPLHIKVEQILRTSLTQ